VISGMATGAGISVTANSRLRVVDSIIRDNGSGILVDGGAQADISRTKIFGNTNYGVQVRALGGMTTASITDTVLSQNNYGAHAFSDGGNARIYLRRVTASRNVAQGVMSESLSGTSVVAVGESLVTANGVGLNQSGGTAILRTLGNNHVAENTLDVSGTITTLPPR
jgi:nitrous oxidase accessory protein NosD